MSKTEQTFEKRDPLSAFRRLVEIDRFFRILPIIWPVFDHVAPNVVFGLEFDRVADPQVFDAGYVLHFFRHNCVRHFSGQMLEVLVGGDSAKFAIWLSIRIETSDDVR